MDGTDHVHYGDRLREGSPHILIISNRETLDETDKAQHTRHRQILQVLKGERLAREIVHA